MEIRLIGFSLLLLGLNNPTDVCRLPPGRIKKSKVILSKLIVTHLGHSFHLVNKPMTHTNDVSGSHPQAGGMVEKPTQLLMSLPLKWKISLESQRAWRQILPMAHISTGKGRPFCVDFNTHGT